MMDNIITRDESKLHIVPTKVISTMPIFMIMMCISIIISIVLFCKQKISVALIWLSVALICWVWGKFVDIYFDFHKNYKIEFQSNQVKITYDLDNQIYPSKDCKVTIIINKVTKLVSKHNKIVIYGDITKKQPRQNKKEIKKYVIDLHGFTNYDTILKKLEKYM